MYAAELIRNQRTTAALRLFIQHGAPAKAQNFNIYRHLATEIFLQDIIDYDTFAGLRNMFHQLVISIARFFSSYALSRHFLLLDSGADNEQFFFAFVCSIRI